MNITLGLSCPLTFLTDRRDETRRGGAEEHEHNQIKEDFLLNTLLPVKVLKSKQTQKNYVVDAREIRGGNGGGGGGGAEQQKHY